jgi:hypothetical protein
MAVTPAVSAAFPDALNPIFEQYKSEDFAGASPDLIPALYGSGKSDRDKYQASSISGLADFTAFAGNVDYASPVEGYDVTATHIEFAQGVQIQRKLWDDAQTEKIKQIFAGQRRAAHNTRQKDAAQPFNNAFTTDNEFFSHSEGVNLASNSHTSPMSGVSTASGFDNLLTAALAGTAVTAARYTMRNLKDFTGEPIDEVPNLILVPAELEAEAEEIVKTKTGLDADTGNFNVEQGRYEIISTVRLTDTNNWFALNKRLMKENLIWIDRVALELKRMEAFDPISFKSRGYMRYSYLYCFWQWMIGHQVS